MRRWLALAGLMAAFAVPAIARHKNPIDDRLKEVHTLFVAGNNQAAEGARNQLEKDSAEKKRCFALSINPKEADAVLEIGADTSSEGQGPGSFGSFGGRNWIASGSLTTKSGDMIWQHSERFSDAPFSSGGKTAGKVLYLELSRDACDK